MTSSRALPRGGIAVVVLALLGTLAVIGIRQVRTVPDARQNDARVRQVRALEPLRSGRIRTHVVPVGGGAPGTSTSGAPDTIRYSLQSPHWSVEDAEIRGLLGAEPKYAFNQGTAYHMRIGRRFAGPSDGLYELKRGLARWALPKLPEGARVVSATATFWVEGHDRASPLATGQERGVLHLYAYPIDGRWVEGAGGEKRDNFSPASPGEVTWKDARSGVEPWPAPGGLGPGKDGYAHSALAMTPVRGDERTVMLGGPALAAHVASRASEGKTLDLLLKLDDGEEDRLGTEIGLMTSEFGDEHDAHSKRPRLDVVVALPQGGTSRTEGFTIEPGQDHRLGPVLHRGSTVLLAADLEEADGGVPPGIFVRGGAGEPSESSAWVPLTSPVERRWDWSQFLVRSPMTRLPIGDSLEIRLREFWVRPGPRERQVPELVLVSPSGELLRLAGHPGERDEYRLPIRPEEPGLWRYGWSFRPTPNRPPESHRGEGLFYVSLPGAEDPGASARVERWSQGLLKALRAGRVSKASAQAQVNALCRWVATRAASAPSSERPALDRMVRETRAALAKSSS